MPKTIIEFSAEEDHELEMCQNGMRYHSALWDFKNYLRSEIKYAEHTNEEYKILEQVQDNFFRILTEFKADLE
jgi:alpha-tubulin suppressor-like RCC1 family protein